MRMLWLSCQELNLLRHSVGISIIIMGTSPCIHSEGLQVYLILIMVYPPFDHLSVMFLQGISVCNS